MSEYTVEQVLNIAEKLSDVLETKTGVVNGAVVRKMLLEYADTLSKPASPLSAFVNAPHDEKQWIGQQVAARVDEMMDEPADSGRVDASIRGLREYMSSLPAQIDVAKEHEAIGCASWPDLFAYHEGVSGHGDRAYTWKDKPHRIVYSLTHELAYLRELVKSAIAVQW